MLDCAGQTVFVLRRDARPVVRPAPSHPVYSLPLTHPAPELIAQALSSAHAGGSRVCVGIDTVRISGLRESLDTFGSRFTRRLFTDGEQAAAAAQADGGVDRLAARFAAKEAAIKAFGLGDIGVNWRDIEVVRQPDGEPRLCLHGRAAQRAHALGVRGMAVSMSHDGDQACAVVVAWADAPETGQNADNPDESRLRLPHPQAGTTSLSTDSFHD